MSVRGGQLSTHFLSDNLTKNIEREDQVQVDQWYFVENDQNMYPGEVKETREGEFLVCTMVQTRQNWKWPTY